MTASREVHHKMRHVIRPGAPWTLEAIHCRSGIVLGRGHGAARRVSRDSGWRSPDRGWSDRLGKDDVAPLRCWPFALRHRGRFRGTSSRDLPGPPASCPPDRSPLARQRAPSRLLRPLAGARAVARGAGRRPGDCRWCVSGPRWPGSVGLSCSRAANSDDLGGPSAARPGVGAAKAFAIYPRRGRSESVLMSSRAKRGICTVIDVQIPRFARDDI
jgi:hypothetical protein